MIYRIPTSGRQVSLEVEVHTKEPRRLIFVGFDPLFNNTEYFHRERIVYGDDFVVFHMPLSPRTLFVYIFDAELPQKKDPGTFTLSRFKLVSLKTRRNEIGRYDLVNIRFLERFARRAGYAFRGLRKNPSTGLVIHYLPVISDGGVINPTPARIHKKANYIQVSSKHFKRMTIPERMAILLHEYSHNFKNRWQDSEREADYHAMKFYTRLGYPDPDAITAFTKIFGDTDTNVARIDAVLRQVKAEGHEARISFLGNDFFEPQYKYYA